jgi:glycosyltransferase involved in cell wall biosynthesis
MHAEVPVLASKMVEIERIINQFDCGEFIDNHEPKHIADKLNRLLTNDVLLKHYKQNASKAKEALSWEIEVLPFLNTVHQLTKV